MADRIKSINWMVSEYEYFNLAPETFCLAVNIYDRFMLINKMIIIKPDHLTIACMHIACKYEEVNPPVLLELLQKKKDEIKGVIIMEREILCALEHRLTLPTVLTYIQKYIGNDPIIYKKSCDIFINNIVYLNDTTNVKNIAKHICSRLLIPVPLKFE